jgi:hypothetical protein
MLDRLPALLSRSGNGSSIQAKMKYIEVLTEIKYMYDWNIDHKQRHNVENVDHNKDEPQNSSISLDHATDFHGQIWWKTPQRMTALQREAWGHLLRDELGRRTVVPDDRWDCQT